MTSLEHDAKRALGSSNLTVSIYRAVVEAGRPVTSDDIYEAVKEWINHTDTMIWWKKRSPPQSPGTGVVNEYQYVARRRVRHRVHGMAASGVLISDGGRGTVGARYSPGKPPMGFRKLERPGGWFAIDVRQLDAARSRHIAVIGFLHAARAELAKERPQAKALQPLLAEAVRLLTERATAED